MDECVFTSTVLDSGFQLASQHCTLKKKLVPVGKTQSGITVRTLQEVGKYHKFICCQTVSVLYYKTRRLIKQIR